MKAIYDEDEFESVVQSRPCTTCGGDMRKCDGGCNGYMIVSSRRRSPEKIAKIKAERERQREDAILAEAEAIRIRRQFADGQ